MRAKGLPWQGSVPDGVAREAPPSPTAVLVALAAPGRNPADLTLPTAGTQATDPPGEGGHETSGSQGVVGWIWGGITYAAQKVDQATGVVGTFALTGQVVSMEAASGSQLLGAAALGTVQGGANTLNGVQDAVIGTVNLPAAAINKVTGGNLAYIPSPDWSRDRFVSEDGTAHEASKFLGGTGVLMLAGGGLGRAAGAAGAAGTAQAQAARLSVQAGGKLGALMAGAPAASAAGVGVVAGGYAGALGNIVQMSVGSQGPNPASTSSGVSPQGTPLSPGQQSAIRKIDNIIKGHLKPGPKGDISGTVSDMVGNPIPTPSGGFWDHAQEMQNSLRGLRNHAATLDGVADPAAQAARQRALDAIAEIEAAIKGAGL